MKHLTQKKATLLFQDGLSLSGYSIGKQGTVGGELCFNTGMTGYQEIYTDPSYYGQIIVNTTCHIGNYGTSNTEIESDSVAIKGLVVNEFSINYSRKKGTESLQSFLERNNTIGIAGVDTRKIVQHIRKKGVMNVIISSELDGEDIQKELDKIPSMKALELATQVTTKSSYEEGKENSKFKIAVIDLGIKKSILKNLTERGCHCKVFPAKTNFSEMKSWNPDGYFISNGPGDPAVMDYASDTVKEILDTNVPLFGICMGLQILAKAIGIPTYKMHHGHRGLNHPVKNLITGLSEITSQNHGFAVDMEALKKSNKAELTHIDLNHNTVEGLRVIDKPAFAVQYHPESSPGPRDSIYLFDDFIKLIKNNR